MPAKEGGAEPGPRPHVGAPSPVASTPEGAGTGALPLLEHDVRRVVFALAERDEVTHAVRML